MSSDQIYDLVIYNRGVSPWDKRIELHRVVEGEDLFGLNVVYCDPHPIIRAREGSLWAINLCVRIMSRVGGTFGIDPKELSDLRDAATKSDKEAQNEELRRTFKVGPPKIEVSSDPWCEFCTPEEPKPVDLTSAFDSFLMDGLFGPFLPERDKEREVDSKVRTEEREYIRRDCPGEENL
jgi:hypothetical protein